MIHSSLFLSLPYIYVCVYVCIYVYSYILVVDSGGRDLSGNKRTNKDQSFDQKFEKQNEALRVSCRKGYPVRVVR